VNFALAQWRRELPIFSDSPPEIASGNTLTHAEFGEGQNHGFLRASFPFED
jgi:hypothetical protein